jgi:antagonist of KipI
MKALTVLNAGVSTTVQDLGRYGYQQYGVPPSGALDSHAFRLGNLLLGNAESAASLEITLPGCRLQACRDTVIAITGADLGATVNGQPVKPGHTPERHHRFFALP